MTKLGTLRGRLAELKSRREIVRQVTGYAGLGVAILWTLCGAFLIDWLLQMSRVQRFVMLAGTVGIMVWAFVRYVRPWLSIRETEIDIALLVEKQQELDSDLVAAIQFESPDAVTWGSGQLQHAVIDYVADFGKGWNILGEVPRQAMTRRATALGVTLAIVALGFVISPGHGLAFLNRYFLGSAHYPTRTVIRGILVNDQPVEKGTIRCPYGVPLRFTIQAGGKLPADGSAVVRTVTGNVESTLKLTTDPATPGVFSGHLSEIVDSLTYQLYLGDAWTDPATIELITLPVVEPRLTATAPDYARGDQRAAVDGQGTRELAVIEGSHIDLQVSCRNKSLTEVALTIDGQKYPMQASGQTVNPGRLWTLDSANTPLAAIAKPLRYQIQVTDSDGMHLPQPIEGMLRIKPDQKPRIFTSAVAKQILPTAVPPIDYRVSDDYGVQALTVHVEITHHDGTVDDRPVVPVRSFAKPVLKEQLPLKDAFPLELKDLKLVKGDQLKVTFAATDYRGSLPGQTADSEPLVFNVTDEAGIFTDINESDQKAAGDFERLIKQQLGIGGTP